MLDDIFDDTLADKAIRFQNGMIASATGGEAPFATAPRVLRFPYNRLHAMCDCQASGGTAMLEKTETTVPIISVPSANQSSVRVVDGRSRVLVRSDQVNGAYAQLEQEIPAGKGPPLHVHRHETEIFYVVAGEFEFRIGPQTVRGGPGTNAACPRDIPHTFRNVGSGPACLLLTIIPGRFGDFFLEVDAISNSDHDAIKALAAKYDVEILE
jgi:quercetin dioxygenase-like cupin family protein